MAATQRVQVQDGVTWTVVDDDGRVLAPVESYLEFARQSDYSPNTIRSYAKGLAGAQRGRLDGVLLASVR